MKKLSRREIDIKDKLMEYIPEIFLILEKQEISWKRVNSLFIKKHNQRVETVQEGELIEASFFDVVSKSLYGVQEASRLINMFKHLFKSLGELLTDDEKRQSSRIIYDMLVNHDKAFFNFIGELLILNSIKKGGGVLVKREYQIPGSQKRVDYLFTGNGKCLLVEVVNIHIQDYANLALQEIISKVNNKLSEKNILKGDNVTFYLAPVLWGSPEDLRRVREAFLTGQICIDNLLTPCAYVHFSNEYGVNIIRFADIITLFDHPKTI